MTQIRKQLHYTSSDRLQERAVIVGVKLPTVSDFEFGESLDELASLAASAEASVVARVTQVRARIDPTFFIGKGKVEETKEAIGKTSANLVICDEQLSPAQVRNLERQLETKVIDRGALILDIFGRRATTKEARVQVEMAQLEYLLPRLTKQWVHLSKQVGGIGTRGPGETQLESDRRLTRKRISVLADRLKDIDKEREVQRRRRREFFNVCLVGYTNAGKSTLFNALTNEKVWAENMLFCTLDSTSRAMKVGNGRKIIFTDTVGFIRKLPHQLVASFRATLDEVRFADLLLHVIDFSHPNYLKHAQVVGEVLNEIGAGDVRMIKVFNKMDRSPEAYLEFGQIVAPEADKFFVSATKRIGLDLLIKRIAAIAEDRKVRPGGKESLDGQKSGIDSR
jgi:GTP-binding protein HflX